MFIHFGNLDLGIFGNRDYLPLVGQAMVDSPGPVVISISQVENNSGIVFTPEVVGPAMDLIYMSGRQVFVKIACSPSVVRVGVEAAVQDALYQVQAIEALFIGYNMADRLQGYALNNILFGELFNDGSRWTVDAVNRIADAIHGFNRSVMFMGDPSVSVITKFNQPQPLNETPSFNNYAALASSVGVNSGITDYVVHLNVLYPWHLYSAAYPELTFDLSRFAAILSVMKTFNKANVKHFCHQGHPQAPYPNYFKPGFDGIGGPMMTPHHTDAVKRCANFIEAAGIVDYTLTMDTAYGAISNSMLHPLSYRTVTAEVQVATYENKSMTSSNGVISITDNTDQSVRRFNSGLKEITNG